MNTPTPIWDGFVRGYHWLQAGSIVGLWYTGTEGLMDWHFAIAYLMLTLLLSRLIWGVIGSETARFRHFIHSPSAVLNYLRSLHVEKTPPAQHLGHNPAGGYMVLMFFVLLSVQLATGLFANDDIISEGPLAMYVSSDTSSYMTYIHAINFNLLLAATGVHLAAILLYLIKKENLIKPMLSGRKVVSETVTPKLVNGLVGWVIFTVIGGVIYIYWAKDIVAYLF